MWSLRPHHQFACYVIPSGRSDLRRAVYMNEKHRYHISPTESYSTLSPTAAWAQPFLAP